MVVKEVKEDVRKRNSKRPTPKASHRGDCASKSAVNLEMAQEEDVSKEESEAKREGKA